MVHWRRVIEHLARHGSLYFFLVAIIFSVDRQGRLASSGNPAYGPFDMDVAEYYNYLPTLFYCNEQDITQNFKENKRTIGMAIMYLPGFLVGKFRAGDAMSPKVCSNCTDLEIDGRGKVRKGFSKPYHLPIRWESILITLLGLFFSRLSLRMFFQDTIVLIALVGILFGTNLFHYTYAEGGMPHSYLFFLFSVFIYTGLKFMREGRHRHLLWMGLVGGMITLIRPTDALVLLFPLLYGMVTKADIWARWQLLVSKPGILVGATLLFLLPLLVQMVIWKVYLGQFVFYSYNNERFFFNDPQITNFLFSYRKGWLLYTPIMVFACIGIALTWKHLREFFPFLLIFTAANIYVLSSWWDWAYGGSFGCRPLIESYAILIFPLATFVGWCWSRWPGRNLLRLIPRVALGVAFYLLIYLNLFQTWQYHWQVIHWNGMNAKTYWYAFLKDDTTEDDLNYLHSIVTPPDPEQLILGNRD